MAERAQVALNRWKAGTAEPRLLAAWRVARELGVGLDVLLGYQPASNSSGLARCSHASAHASARHRRAPIWTSLMNSDLR